MKNLLKHSILKILIASLGVGLYPIFFYYDKNYTLVSSWEHLWFFIRWFILLPASFFSILFILKNKVTTAKWHAYLTTFGSLSFFLILLLVSKEGELNVLKSFIAVIISAITAYFIKKHFTKVIVLQYVIASVGFVWLAPNIYKHIMMPTEWMEQPDSIEDVVFKKRPNVYFIQPDGYTNFSELKRGYYKIDNVAFENFIANEEFVHYPDFRSNYSSTLTSNSSMFMMKHHYYNNSKGFGELPNARNIVISNNKVLDIFKKNGYKTHFLAEYPYFLLSRPTMVMMFVIIAMMNYRI